MNTFPLPVPPLPPAPPSGVTVPPDAMAVYLSNGARILLDATDDSITRLVLAMRVPGDGTLIHVQNLTTGRMEIIRSTTISRVIMPARITDDVTLL